MYEENLLKEDSHLPSGFHRAGGGVGGVGERECQGVQEGGGGAVLKHV